MRALAPALAVVVVAFAVLTASPAAAKRGLEIGLADPLYTSSKAGTRDTWLERTKQSRVGLIKIFVNWSGLVSGKPKDARDPADPAYSFSGLDAYVADAEAKGLEVILGVQQAPGFAEGKKKPKKVAAGTWKPKPGDVGDFMFALAKRYSGNFNGLPQVRNFQLWNEQNLGEFLTPQYQGKKLVAPDHYRDMLNAAYKSVHQASSGARLITGGTAPYGDPAGDRSRPLEFLRKLFCLKDRKKLKPAKCPKKSQRAHFDVLAHHAINTSGPPTQSAINPDDASSADLGQVNRTLKAAEKSGRALGPKHHDLWVTEFWFESNPPDKKQGYPLAKQAAYIAQSMYLFWKAGATVAVGLRIRDGNSAADPDGRIATGAYLFNGKAKPAARAYSFPFVADRKSKKKVELWGKAPKAGKVVIEQKKGKAWKKVEKAKAGSNRIFDTKTKLGGKAKLRARAGGETSLVWKLK